MTVDEAAREIEAMEVRGAGAIARHAAGALASWANAWDGEGDLLEELDERAERLRATRPTAVSLGNALDYVQARAREDPRVEAVVEAGRSFVSRSEDAVDAIGEHGVGLVEGGRYLTHCNSQAARSVFREARNRGRGLEEVLATETRPWRQGLVTVEELREDDVPTAFIVDGAAVHFLPSVEAVFVGCDSLAANGDVVNKVGTAALALACREEGVPFYVCAETYKVDLEAGSGDEVPIEERPVEEVADPGVLPEGVTVYNPVFDVTPADRVTGVVTEEGVLEPDEVASRARKRWR
jgi:ribose 1,5-bisphosphate isomerase